MMKRKLNDSQNETQPAKKIKITENEELKLTKSELPAVYNFTFQQKYCLEDDSNLLDLLDLLFPKLESESLYQWCNPAFIPLDIWKHHVMPYLIDDPKTRSALRLSCRGFMFLVSTVWKPKAMDLPKDESTWKFWKLHWQTWPFHLDTLEITGERLPRKVKPTAFGERFQTLSIRSLIIHDWLKVASKSQVSAILPLKRTLVELTIPACCLDMNILSCLNNFYKITTLRIGTLGKYFWPSTFHNSIFKRILIKEHKEIFSSLPPRITELHLNYLPSIIETGVIIAALQQKNLKTLSLHSSGITNEQLLLLPPTLQTLSVANSDFLTDEGIKNLPQNLTSLNLTQCRKLTGRALAELPPTLRELFVSFTYLGITLGDFTDLVVNKNLANLKSLLHPQCYFTVKTCTGLVQVEEKSIFFEQLDAFKNFWMREFNVPIDWASSLTLVDFIREYGRDILAWCESTAGNTRV